MKSYIVKCAFTNIDGSFLRPGDYVECDDARAARLRRFGKTGGSIDALKSAVPKTATQNEDRRETGIKPGSDRTAVQTERKKEKRG